MQKTCLKKMMSYMVSSVLIAAMALSATACGKKGTQPESTVVPEEVTVLGEGENEFMFSVRDAEGTDAFYKICTDESIVGDALEEIDMISGEDGQFGLYVKTVDGTTLDYDKDKMYWAFYVNGEYAPKGVDQTEITEGEEYSFRAEK